MIFSDQFVVLGAGNLGRRVARAVRPVVFCDNNGALWGSVIDGIPVVSPEDAVKSYPNATYVVAIWHPSRIDKMTDRIYQLKSLGASRVMSFCELFDEYENVLLPNLLWQRRDYYRERDEEIHRARRLLDAAGQEEFDRQMRLRSGDFFGQVIDAGVQYFPSDFLQLHGNEVFIDCGAYDGDTIAEFRRATRDQFDRIVAFEPDPRNFALLKAAANGDPRIVLQPYATGAKRGTLRFAAGDGVASRISPTGTCEVEATALDEALDGVAPTYMKFDIEGSEPDALEGGRETITRHRPKMAVCLYHAPDHLWSIPLSLNELLPDSRFTLRTYCADGFECVCYCIPR
jgi:FkbM family methyltransferase